MIKPSSTTLAKIYLTEPQRLMVYRLYAEFKSPAKVRDLLASEYNIVVSDKFVYEVCNSLVGITHVQKFRDDFTSRVKDVAIANKRVRLEKFQENANEIDEMKVKADIETSEGRGEKLMMQRRLNETLCAAREEVEGSKISMAQFNISTHAHMTDDELNKRIDILVEKARTIKTVEVSDAQGPTA